MSGILITGATGFVGRVVVSALQAEQMKLTCVVRPDSRPSISDRLTRFVVPSIDGGTNWQGAFAGVSTVVHLAARSHIVRERSPDPLMAHMVVNHAGTVRLFEAAVAHGVKTFIFVSTIGVLGASTVRGADFDDNSSPRPSGPYALSKYAAEQDLIRMAAGTQTQLVILRPPLVYGPCAKGNLDLLVRVCSWKVPLPLGGIKNSRTLLSVFDLASAIKAVIERSSREPVSGTYVLGEDQPVSTPMLIKRIRSALGMPAGLVTVPRSLLVAALKLAGKERMCEQLLGDLKVNSSGFQRAFGWKPAMNANIDIQCLVSASAKKATDPEQALRAPSNTSAAQRL